jgi:hypothetical protein
MMGWTEADGDALFRQPPDEQAGEDASSGFDGSHEAMRRLRFPFEADPADARGAVGKPGSTIGEYWL